MEEIMSCCSNGVYGARLGIYPMQDQFATLILDAVRKSDRRNLAVFTDDMGTGVQGSGRRVFDYVAQVISHAFSGGGHTVAQVLFSYGCDGDVPEKIPRDTDEEIPFDWEDAGDIHCSCTWSYYPLGSHAHLEHIENAVSRVTERENLSITRTHYATRIDGTLKEMFSALEEAFERSVRGGIHTVFHLTLSKGSPSKPHTQIHL